MVITIQSWFCFSIVELLRFANLISQLQSPHIKMGPHHCFHLAEFILVYVLNEGSWSCKIFPTTYYLLDSLHVNASVINVNQTLDS